MILQNIHVHVFSNESIHSWSKLDAGHMSPKVAAQINKLRQCVHKMQCYFSKKSNNVDRALGSGPEAASRCLTIHCINVSDRQNCSDGAQILIHSLEIEQSGHEGLLLEEAGGWGGQMEVEFLCVLILKVII